MNLSFKSRFPNIWLIYRKQVVNPRHQTRHNNQFQNLSTPLEYTSGEHKLDTKEYTWLQQVQYYIINESPGPEKILVTDKDRVDYGLVLVTLKWKCCHFDEIFITGCNGSCQKDNFWCSQWWKISLKWLHFHFSEWHATVTCHINHSPYPSTSATLCQCYICYG